MAAPLTGAGLFYRGLKGWGWGSQKPRWWATVGQFELLGGKLGGGKLGGGKLGGGRARAGM